MDVSTVQCLCCRCSHTADVTRLRSAVRRPQLTVHSVVVLVADVAAHKSRHKAWFANVCPVLMPEFNTPTDRLTDIQMQPPTSPVFSRLQVPATSDLDNAAGPHRSQVYTSTLYHGEPRIIDDPSPAYDHWQCCSVRCNIRNIYDENTKRSVNIVFLPLAQIEIEWTPFSSHFKAADRNFPNVWRFLSEMRGPEAAVPMFTACTVALGPPSLSLLPTKSMSPWSLLLQFDFDSTAIRPRSDRSMTCVMTVLPVMGCQNCDLNKYVYRSAWLWLAD